MSDRDWFRKESWTEEDREDFFEHFKRTWKSKRGQYLRLQAHHLVEAGTDECIEGALELLDLFFEEYPDTFQFPPAYQHKAECLEYLGRIEEARIALRASIDSMEEYSTIETQGRMRFAMFVIRHDLEDSYSEALEILDDQDDSFVMPANGYWYHGAKAILLDRMGEKDGVEQHASTSLNAAQKEKSKLGTEWGTVTEKDTSFHSELKQLVESEA